MLVRDALQQDKWPRETEHTADSRHFPALRLSRVTRMADLTPAQIVLLIYALFIIIGGAIGTYAFLHES